MNENRKQKIKKVFSGWYVYSFIGVFIIYLVINTIVNKVYVTAPTLLNNNLKIITPYILLILLIAALVATNINLLVLKFIELRRVNKESGLTFIGLFGGLLGGACPSCFVGLFPVFLGLFGVTASLSSLPFFGLEILFGSAILLILAIFLLTKDNICKIKRRF